MSEIRLGQERGSYAFIWEVEGASVKIEAANTRSKHSVQNRSFNTLGCLRGLCCMREVQLFSPEFEPASHERRI